MCACIHKINLELLQIICKKIWNKSDFNGNKLWNSPIHENGNAYEYRQFKEIKNYITNVYGKKTKNHLFFLHFWF